MKPTHIAIILVFVRALPAAASTWTTGTYVYDSSGNIVRMGVDQYVYDRNGRLAKGTANGPSHRQEYTYDSFGNRLSATTCVNEVCTPAPLSVTAATNHVQGVTYGDAGNAENGHSIFDAAEMISADGAREYIYTANDERIAVHKGTDWQWSVRDLGQRVARDFTSSDTAGAWTTTEDYVHTDRGIAGSVSARGRRHMHLDHLGTPRLMTAEDGHQIGLHAYYPFGEGLALTSESPAERLKFTGHERDDSGLDYMHARYYGAGVGRFVSVDPTWSSADLGKPQSWNRYAYVVNNPVNMTDRDGKCPICILVVLGIAGGMFLNPAPANAPGPADVIYPNNDPAGIGGAAAGVAIGTRINYVGHVERITRYMTDGEAKVARDTGTIPNVGRDGIHRPTHATTDAPVNDPAVAQQRYEITKPTHRATVPKDRLPGGLGPSPDGRPLTSGYGSQGATDQPIPVRPHEIKPMNQNFWDRIVSWFE
jgi:RHS repeat-associated protein